MKRIRYFFISMMSVLLAVITLSGCATPEVAITFNSNGGSEVKKATVSFNSYLAEPSEPTKKGYTFKYWCKTNTNDCQKFNFNAKVKTKTTLYAQWELDKYTINFNKQGGSGGTDNATVSYDYPMPAAIAPTREGYTFSGYYDSLTEGFQYYTKNMTGVKDYDKDSNITLYARWVGIGYKVTFNRQNGVGGTDSVTAVYGSAMPEAIAPTKKGYTFEGYYESDYSINKYYDSEMNSVKSYDKSSDFILYAKWSVNEYKVTFDNQDGSVTQDSIVVIYGNEMPIATIPTRTGFNFLGYFDAITGGTKYYNSDMTSAKKYDKDSNITLYAKWEGKEYLITFDNQDGVGNVESINAIYGSSMPVVTAPTKTGNFFLGYFDAKIAGKKYYDYDMSSYMDWDKVINTTLYARWTTAYTVTFDNQGGGEDGYSIKVGYNAAMPKANIPKKDGYIFTGYYDAISDGNKYYNSDMSSSRNYDKSSNTTLYARWEDEDYYTPGLVFRLINNDTEYTIESSSNHNGEIFLPKVYKGLPVTTIESTAFNYSYIDLIIINIPNSITSISPSAFLGCNALASINVDPNNPNYQSIEGNLYSKDGETLIQYAIGKLNTSFIIPNSVSSIDLDAFYKCDSLISIMISNSVTLIGERAFYGWTSSQTIYIKGYESAPSSWDYNWNYYCNATIVWNYQG